MGLGKIDAILKRYSKTIREVEIGSYWYRRILHACGGPLIVGLFILADESWMLALKTYGAPIIFVTIVGMDALRLKGVLPQQMFYGMREYEQKRPMGVTYFAIAALTLFMLAQYKLIPQSIAITCLLCGCLVDPAMGEARQAKGRCFGMPVGFLLAFILFFVLGFEWYIALFGAFLVMAGESVKSWLIDDDLLIQMLPAVGLIIAWKAGLRMPPDPVVPIPLPPWAYINMDELPAVGIALAVAIVVLFAVGFAYYGIRHVNKGISATKSMLPLTLFLMITPLFVGLIFLLGWPNVPHPTTHVYLGMIMLISAVTVDFATVRDMIRKTKMV